MASPPFPEIAEEDLPELDDGQFPPSVETDEQRKRFRLAYGIAQRLMGEDEGPTVWQMARSIYNNPDLPT